MKKNNSKSKVMVIIIALVIGVGFLFSGAAPTQAKQEVFRIGAVLPITGSIAHFGGWQIRGQDLALSDLEKQGWINGKKLEIIREDSEYEPRKAIAAYKKLVSLDKVNVILTGGSPEIRALAPLGEQDKVVILYLGTSNADIRKSGTYIFKIMGGQVTEMYALAKHAIDKKKAKKAAVIGIDTEYGKGGTGLFKKYFENMGGKVVATESVRPGTREYATILTKIDLKKPDVIVLILSSQGAGPCIRQVHRLGIKAHVLGGMNVFAPEVPKVAGSEAAEGLSVVAYQFDPIHGTPAMVDFNKKHTERYGEFAVIISGNAYDAVMLYSEAVKNGARSSDEIRSFLRNIKEYKGVTGTITFDKWSENMPTHRILDYTGGEFKEVRRFKKFTEEELK